VFNHYINITKTGIYLLNSPNDTKSDCRLNEFNFDGEETEKFIDLLKAKELLTERVDHDSQSLTDEFRESGDNANQPGRQ
jgi:hypothetical protein